MSSTSVKSGFQAQWRGGSLVQNQICADCGSLGKCDFFLVNLCFLLSWLFNADVTWASLNRGVLICEECCSVHRVLGRHISQLKPLRKAPGGWPPSLLTVLNRT